MDISDGKQLLDSVDHFSKWDNQEWIANSTDELGGRKLSTCISLDEIMSSLVDQPGYKSRSRPCIRSTSSHGETIEEETSDMDYNSEWSGSKTIPKPLARGTVSLGIVAMENSCSNATTVDTNRVSVAKSRYANRFEVVNSTYMDTLII